jgi:hypothetical protein
MPTQESSYLYALTAAVVVVATATLLLLAWALRGFQIFW